MTHTHTHTHTHTQTTHARAKRSSSASILNKGHRIVWKHAVELADAIQEIHQLTPYMLTGECTVKDFEAKVNSLTELSRKLAETHQIYHEAEIAALMCQVEEHEVVTTMLSTLKSFDGINRAT